MKIKIKVTKDILKKSANCVSGTSSVGTNCAIALAVRELFPFSFTNLREIHVFSSVADLTMFMVENATISQSTSRVAAKHNAVNITLPIIAQDFIEHFDHTSTEDRVTMHPISFDVDVPDMLIDNIGIGTIYKVLSESKSMEMVMN